jgi:thiamine biosynthesis lipoprotein
MMVRCARPAMATVFEAWLVGDDEEHLHAVGEAILDDVERIERLLSRHNPAAEVARVNREAGSRRVRIDRELSGILVDCRAWFEKTDGYFDICTPSQRFAEAVELDEASMTVRFLDPSTALDLGGYGKGYALDAASRLLDEFGVTSALLHGGTSSILVRGRPEGDSGWRVGIRDPYQPEEADEVASLRLADCGVSSSAVLDPGSVVSDLVDPLTRRPLTRQAACTVIAATAVEAEVLSTALIAMGKERAKEYLETRRPASCRVAWVEQAEGRARLEWLMGEGDA